MERDKVTCDFINLIRSAVLGESYDLSGSDLSKLEKLARFHSLECLALDGFKNSKVNVSDSFLKVTKTNKFKVLMQEEELSEIKKWFSDAKIKYLPLKGAIISNYYEKKEWRNKADLDILVKEEDLKKAGEILMKNGYSKDQLGGNHDSYKKEPFIKIELHRSMIDDMYSTHNYFKDVWDSSYIYNDGFEYYLKDEYFYLFLVSHAYKHFINGGGGFRFLIDVYYFNKHLEKTNKPLDLVLVNRELKKMGLAKFNSAIINASNYLFKGIEASEDTMFFVDYLVSSGIYGTLQNVSSDGVLKKGSKGKYILRRLFPSFKMMKKRNPVLKKVPILLPWFYFTRLLKGAFHPKKSIGMYNVTKNTTENDINKMKKIMEIVGAGENEN